jgi:hypothetical protein
MKIHVAPDRYGSATQMTCGCCARLHTSRGLYELKIASGLYNLDMETSNPDFLLFVFMLQIM